jgi:hypothetical protein
MLDYELEQFSEHFTQNLRVQAPERAMLRLGTHLPSCASGLGAAHSAAVGDLPRLAGQRASAQHPAAPRDGNVPERIYAQTDAHCSRD